MRDVHIGDEVFSSLHQMYAPVVEIFPAAVCVRVGMLTVNGKLELIQSPQLWRADDIENLSVCRYCGRREDVELEATTSVPYRVCAHCQGLDVARHDEHPSPWWQFPAL
ncbi:MAG: hypothetical protein MUD01_11650 [Chloroflexaceae bacterium]|nr:hypothetical protein [Chloroflexaceae bacterium]